jgi:uncharacterized protein
MRRENRNQNPNTIMKSKTTAATTLGPDGTPGRVALLDWRSIAADLDGHGCAVIGPLIAHEQCVELAACYDTPGIFRSHVVMARHGFG